VRVLSINDIPDIYEIIKSRACLYCGTILSPKIKLDFCSKRCMDSHKTLQENYQNVQPERELKNSADGDRDISAPLDSIINSMKSSTSLPSLEDLYKRPQEISVLPPSPEITCPHCSGKQIDKGQKLCIHCTENLKGKKKISEVFINCPHCTVKQELKKGQTHCVECKGNITGECIFCRKEQIVQFHQKFCVHCGIPWKQPCPSCNEEISLRPEKRIKCEHCHVPLRICSICHRCYPVDVLKCQNSYCENSRVEECKEKGEWNNMGGDIYYSNCVMEPPCFSDLRQLWRHNFPQGHRLYPPLNISETVVVASREGVVLFLAEEGDDMKKNEGSMDSIYPPMVLKEFNFYNNITACPCIKDRNVYFGLDTGQIKSIKPDGWQEKEFASELGHIVFLCTYKDRFLVVNRTGDLIVVDNQGVNIFTYSIPLPQGGRFLSLLPLLFYKDSIYYIYNYRAGRNDLRSRVISLNLSVHEINTICEYKELSEQAILYEDKLYISLSNELIIITPDGVKTGGFHLDYSLNVPFSWDRNKQRLVYSYGDRIMSCKPDGTGAARKLQLRSEKGIKTPPIILDNILVYADSSFLYMNNEIRSVTLNENPSPYLSYSNNKIFLTTETGGIYAFRLEEEH